LDIHFTVETYYEGAARLAEENAAAGLSDFSVRGGIFLGKWHSTFVGSSDGKMNVKSACVLNILYLLYNAMTTEQEM
jgi:hypothetical protein